MMAEITIGTHNNRKPLTVGGLALLIVVGVFVVMEIMMLKGQLITSESVEFADPPNAVQVDFNQVPNNVLITVSSGTKKNKVSLKAKLVGPDQKTIYETEETFSHHGLRYYSFKPEQAGKYKLFVTGEKGLFGSTYGRARVSMYANDKRFLWRLWSLKL